MSLLLLYQLTQRHCSIILRPPMPILTATTSDTTCCRGMRWHGRQSSALLAHYGACWSSRMRSRNLHARPGKTEKLIAKKTETLCTGYPNCVDYQYVDGRHPFHALGD